MSLTLLFADGFDVYDTAGLAQWWTTPGTNTAIDSTGTISRSGLGCLKIVSSAFGPSLTLAAHQSQVIMTTAVNMQSQIPTGGNSGSILRAINQFDGVVQVRLDVNSDLSVSAYNGNSPFPTLLGTSAPNVMLANGYNYVAVKFSISSSGIVVVWINGQMILNLSGVVTQFPGKGAFVDTIQLFALGGTITWLHDDVTFWTWSSAGDTFAQEPSVYPSLPVSDSSPLNWTPSTGVTHFSLVNGVPEQTTTYVSDGTVSDTDQYIHAIPNNQKIPALPGSPTVLGVYHALFAELDAAGARSIASNKAGAASGTNFALTTSYLYYGTPYTPGLASFAALTTTPFGPEVTA